MDVCAPAPSDVRTVDHEAYALARTNHVRSSRIVPQARTWSATQPRQPTRCERAETHVASPPRIYTKKKSASTETVPPDANALKHTPSPRPEFSPRKKAHRLRPSVKFIG